MKLSHLCIETHAKSRVLYCNRHSCLTHMSTGIDLEIAAGSKTLIHSYESSAVNRKKKT